MRARGQFLVKADCVLAGLDVAFEAFRILEPTVQVSVRKPDGSRCAPGDVVAEVAGSARTLLVAERTALNFLQRLSGIATIARRFVEAAGGRIVVLDTRKTTPGLRVLEKYAVRAGGATNHRIGLFDAILIKDNHIRIAGGVAAAVCRCPVTSARRCPSRSRPRRSSRWTRRWPRACTPFLWTTWPWQGIREAVTRSAGRAKIEISGGVTLDRVPELAATGADFVSAGAITHSAQAVDISFEIEPIG